MATDIVMPQMGESIVEGTITKWLKKPGDKIQRDEPLFEISTDKVDAEIPAPASGVLQEIKVTEGTTVQVNTVVGTISSDGEGAAAKPAAPEKKAAPASPAPKAQTPAPAPQANGATGAAPHGETASPQVHPDPDRVLFRGGTILIVRVSGESLFCSSGRKLPQRLSHVTMSARE